MSEPTTAADPGTWIRGITIRQPWTTCILAGKDVENRPTAWSWRGLVLLHAGQATERAPMRDPLVATAIRGRALHTRAVIGVARLTDCHQDAPALPIPWLHGQLGPWRPTQDLVDQVLLQLPRLAPEGTS
ncbi:hypothetical protein [Streptomyces goshikiensis]|uniref:hypothetical protein n=1 Tax=Streptomyces goshikiensis TaxID=1942 RepID=UPI00365195D7